MSRHVPLVSVLNARRTTVCQSRTSTLIDSTLRLNALGSFQQPGEPFTGKETRHAATFRVLV